MIAGSPVLTLASFLALLAVESLLAGRVAKDSAPAGGALTAPGGRVAPERSEN